MWFSLLVLCQRGKIIFFWKTERERAKGKLFQLIIVSVLRGTKYENPDGCEVDKFFISFHSELELTRDFLCWFFSGAPKLTFDVTKSHFSFAFLPLMHNVALCSSRSRTQFPKRNWNFSCDFKRAWSERNEIISMISQINLIVKHGKQSGEIGAQHDLLRPFSSTPPYLVQTNSKHDNDLVNFSAFNFTPFKYYFIENWIPLLFLSLCSLVLLSLPLPPNP